MRKLIVSIHSTANNIVTGPPSGDETDFVQWAQPGIEDSQDEFLISLDGVDTIVLGRGTARRDRNASAGEPSPPPNPSAHGCAGRSPRAASPTAGRRAT